MSKEHLPSRDGAFLSGYVRRISAIVLGVIFGIALVIHSIFVNIAGPIYVIDQASPVWMIVLGIFVLLQLPAASAFPPTLRGACCSCCGKLVRLVFFALIAVLATICFIGFLIYGRTDVGIYAFLLAISSGLAMDAVLAAPATQVSSLEGVAADDERLPLPTASAGSRCLELCNALTAVFVLGESDVYGNRGQIWSVPSPNRASDFVPTSQCSPFCVQSYSLALVNCSFLIVVARVWALDSTGLLPWCDGNIAQSFSCS